MKLCDHTKHPIIEVYDTDEEYPKLYPKWYRCTGCDDKFPIMGDTDKWKAKPFPTEKES